MNKPKELNEYFVDHAGVGVKHGRGGRRPGAGRKPKDGSDAMKQRKVYLRDDQLAYLARWSPECSTAMREVIDRAMKMWPKGL